MTGITATISGETDQLVPGEEENVSGNSSMEQFSRKLPNNESKHAKDTPLPATTDSVHDTIHLQPKRSGYLSWDDYFLAVALLSSKRSKDPKSPSGACIVDPQNRITGLGYNGFPRGCSDEIFPWQDGGQDESVDWLHTKSPYLCTAVTNAILNKCSDDVAGCRMYVMEFPSSDCAKVIIQSRIEEVVILETDSTKQEGDTDREASSILFDMAGIKVRYCRPSFSICLDFAAGLVPSDLAGGGERVDESKKVDSQALARKLLKEEANYDSQNVADNGKRKTSISWQDYFMAMAFLTAQRSKDPATQVGACIVDSEKRIIGLGYNGFPRGCSDDHLPWAKTNANPLHNKYLYVCHAEVNAILNKGSANVKGATIYVALFPCENCAKMIIQAGIREVVYMSDAKHDSCGCRASRIMLQCAHVTLRQYIPSMEALELDFNLHS